MAAAWSAEELERIGRAEELEIATKRADGTLRRWVPIWVVRAASYSVLVVTPLSLPPEAEDNLRDIRSITDAALSYLGADEFLTALLSRVKKSLGADKDGLMVV